MWLGDGQRKTSTHVEVRRSKVKVYCWSLFIRLWTFFCFNRRWIGRHPYILRSKVKSIFFGFFCILNMIMINLSYFMCEQETRKEILKWKGQSSRTDPLSMADIPCKWLPVTVIWLVKKCFCCKCSVIINS